MTATGGRSVAELRAGDHACFLYETDEAYGTGVPLLVRQGLEQGELVIHLAAPGQGEGLLQALRAADVAYEPALRSGQLVLIADAVEGVSGGAEPHESPDWLRTATAQVAGGNYLALRVIVEAPAGERLNTVAWLAAEARWHELAAEGTGLIVCLYDRRRFDPAWLLDRLRVHPWIVLDSTVYENVGYVPPERLADQDPAALNLQQWLQSLVAQQQLEDALQASEEQFRLAVEFDYDWEYWTGVDGRFHYVSPACERTTGYRAEEFMRDPGLLEAIVHPDDRARVADHLFAELQLTDVGSLDFRIIARDGEERWIEHKCQPIYGRDGRWLGRRASNRDSTKRQWAEERYRLLVDHSLQGLAILQNERIVFANTVFADLLGYTVDTLTALSGDEIAAMIHPADRPGVLEKMEACLAGRLPFLHQEYRVLDRQGKELWLEHFIVRATYHGRPALQLVVIDVTERKIAEAKITRQNQLLTLLNRAGQALNSTLDLDRVLVTILEETRRLLHVVACSVWLVDPQTGEAVCRQATGYGYEQVIGWRLKPGQGLVGWTLQHNEGLIVSDAVQDSRHFMGVDRQVGLIMRSILSVPLRVHGRVIGVLEALDTELARFSGEDLEAIEPLAAAAASAVENARLYQETERLRAFNETIVQGMQEGIILEDAEGRIIFANASAAAMLGTTLEALRGRSWGQLLAPESRAPGAAEVLHHRPGVASQDEVELVTTAGDRISVLVSTQPLLEGDRVVGLLSVLTNITERKRAEEARRASEQRFRKLLDNVRMAAVILDEEGGLTFCNQFVLELTGWQWEEVSGRNWFDYFVPADQRETVRAMFRQGLAEGTIPPYYENAIVTRAGERRLTSWNNAVLRDPQGRITAVASIGEDITDRRQMEETLRRERDFTTAVLDSAGVLLDVIDRQGRVVRLNRTNEQMTGWTTAELQGRCFWEVLVPPEQQELVKERFADLLAGAAPQYHENDCLLRDGSRRLIAWSDTVLRDAQGVPEYLIGIGVDVTEQRRMEQALRYSRQQYQAVSELTSDYAYALTVDAEGQLHFEWVTDAFTRITGYTPDELEAAGGLAALVAPDDLPILHLNLQLLLAGQQQVSQFRIVTRQGELRWLRQHERPVWDAGNRRVVRIFGAAQDITERRWMEEALRASEQRLSALIASADDLIFMIGLPEERFTFLHVPERYGWSAANVLGRPVVEVLPPDSLAVYRLKSRQVIETGAPCTFEWALELPEERLYLSVSFSPIKDELGAVTAISGIARDITQRKQLEQDLIRVERLALAGRLAASVAHEINNPLQSILGGLGLAQEALLEGQPAGPYLQIAAEEVRRIARIVDRMGDLYRPESEEKEPADINQLVEEVLELSHKLCRDNRVVLVWSPAPDLPPLLVVPERVKQVFWNLLLNAVAAMPEGGQLEIKTQLLPAPPRVAVQFSDTGTGIAPEVMPHIFEPFYSTKAGGTGLGLAISAGIVEQHGGRIEVESQPGQGSTFIVWLPVRPG